MRKLIEGKLYDTETATMIAETQNRLGNSDFRNLDETIYNTKNGKYSLYSHGGAMTKYATSYGGSTGGGLDIIPLTEKEVKEHLENWGKTAKNIELFGKPEEA